MAGGSTGLEDPDLAGRCPLHCAEGVLSRLRVPEHGGFAVASAAALLDAIEEAALLLRAQGEHFGDVCGFLVALGVFQAVHGGFQGFLGGGLVGRFLPDHFPVDLPPVPGVFGVQHFARSVADVPFDQFLPEGAGVLGDLRAGDLEVAELLGVVDAAEDGFYGMVGQVGDVCDVGDVANGGVLGHGH